jgi:hypothetical protein
MARRPTGANREETPRGHRDVPGEPGGGLPHDRRRRAGRALAVLAALGLLAQAASGAWAAGCYPLEYYGSYSVGRLAGPRKVSTASRLRELRDLAANAVVIGDDKKDLDVLPPGLQAIAGCGLMKRSDWQRAGSWDEARARSRLAKVAARYGHDPRVVGICLTHEINEYADHAHRRWMYRLAKEYFPGQLVLHYYSRLWDDVNPTGKKVYGYGLDGEVESDVLFVSMQAVRKGSFSLDQAGKLEQVLRYAARTPGIPVWAQTSVNADHSYVTGPDSMIAIWGAHGENLAIWADKLFRTVHTDTTGRQVRLTGFFWRSLGRFPYDLGYPAFAAQRAQVRAIGEKICPLS